MGGGWRHSGFPAFAPAATGTRRQEESVLPQVIDHVLGQTLVDAYEQTWLLDYKQALFAVTG